MNVWELITTSSGLAVDPANTLWDHMNDLGQGGGTVVDGFRAIDVALGQLSVDADITVVEGDRGVEALSVATDLDQVEIDNELNNVKRDT